MASGRLVWHRLKSLRASITWSLVSGSTATEIWITDDVYQLTRSQFSEKELVDLAMAIIAINGWNRLAVSFRAVAGTYQPPSVTTVQEHESKHPKTGT
jgi:alkylhydroperoxidase family enzyme